MKKQTTSRSYWMRKKGCVTITVDLEECKRDAFKEICEQRNVSVTEAIRQFITDEVNLEIEHRR